MFDYNIIQREINKRWYYNYIQLELPSVNRVTKYPLTDGILD